VALCAVLAYALQTFNYASPDAPFTGADVPGATPLRLAYRAGFATANPGIGPAVEVLLLLILGLLGVVATALVVFSRLRVEVQPTPETAPHKPDTTARQRTRAGVAAAVIMLVLIGITVFALVPWLSAMGHAGELAMRLPGRLSEPRILANTWVPPLMSTVVAVGAGVLGGYGIGALRPMGRWSELLLLPFGPWLFVGVGPLAVQSAIARHYLTTPRTFLDLVPPVWLSIPALFVATLVFRATPPRAGLPLLGLVGLATWIGYAQSAVWPSLGLITGPTMIWLRRAPVGLASTWPVVILVAVGLALAQRRYLDRLVLSVGSAATRPGAPVAVVTTVPAPASAWPLPPPVAVARPAHRRPVNVTLIAVIVAVCVAGVAALVIAILPKRPSSPTAADTVTAFYAALTDRDSARAVALLAPDRNHPRNSRLLNDKTLHDNGYSPPSQVKVTPRPDLAAGHEGLGYEYAAVQVDSVIAGVAQRQTHTLSRTAGTRLGPWLLMDGLGYLPVKTGYYHPTLVVAGITYRDYYGDDVFDVLPGAYVVTLVLPLIVGGPVTVRTGGPPVRMKLDITAETRGEVTKVIHDRIDTCTHRTDPSAPPCPLWNTLDFTNLPTQGRPFRESMTVLSYPTLDLQPGAGPVDVRTTSPGRVRVVERDRTTGKVVFDQTQPFTIKGFASSDGMTIHFTMTP
jgi:hypothetical protein